MGIDTEQGRLCELVVLLDPPQPPPRPRAHRLLSSSHLGFIYKPFRWAGGQRDMLPRYRGGSISGGPALGRPAARSRYSVPSESDRSAAGSHVLQFHFLTVSGFGAAMGSTIFLMLLC